MNNGNMKFEVLDPDWEDQRPVVELAETPEGAVAAFYRNTLLETPPKMHSALISGQPGSGVFGSIGETRVARFVVKQVNDGRIFNVYFD